MSSRIIIRTLRFCTCQIKNLEHTLKLLNYEYTLNEKCIIVNNKHIIIGENDFYMQVDSRETKAIEMFNRINSKLAEIEQMVKAQELIRLSQEQENAEAEMEAYRVRRIKAEKEKITYEKERLELENSKLEKQNSDLSNTVEKIINDSISEATRITLQAKIDAGKEYKKRPTSKKAGKKFNT